MIKDQLYTLGVRVRDALNNLNTNTVTMTSTAIGSVNLAQIYQDLQTDFNTYINSLQILALSMNAPGATEFEIEAQQIDVEIDSSTADFSEIISDNLDAEIISTDEV
jgi:hypothetical protein